jgi:NAD(P)-dependent dehydrogenase (short-subunit alcohol dehydrogenase family)
MLKGEVRIAVNRDLLKGKNALITGAGRGIGRAIALEMANEGANMYFSDIQEDRVRTLERELRKRDVVCEGFVADISRAADVDSICRDIFKGDREIHILCNNVGIESHDQGSLAFTQAEWDSVFRTNVFGPVYLSECISRRMIENRIEGSIIFITSIHQWIIRKKPSYSASKAALGMIISELALKLAPSGIRVNGIAPGYVKEGADGESLPHEYTPLYGSSINPTFIGRAAVFLASDYFSRFTTGSILKIDAGLSLYNHLQAQGQNR